MDNNQIVYKDYVNLGDRRRYASAGWWCPWSATSIS